MHCAPAHPPPVRREVRVEDLNISYRASHTPYVFPFPQSSPAHLLFFRPISPSSVPRQHGPQNRQQQQQQREVLRSQPLFGQMGQFLVFQEVLSAQDISSLYALGPDIAVEQRADTSTEVGQLHTHSSNISNGVVGLNFLFILIVWPNYSLLMIREL